MEKMESRGTFTEYLPSYTIGVDAYKSVLRIVKRFGKKRSSHWWTNRNGEGASKA